MRKPISRSLWLFIFLAVFFLNSYAKAGVFVNVQTNDEIVSVGEQVTFGATVITTAGEVVTGYQWFESTSNQAPFNTVGFSSALVLNNVQTSDAGYYYVTVSYRSGTANQSVSSTSVRLIVNPQPRVVIQPQSLITLVGSNATFTTAVSGTPPLHVQWMHNAAYLSDNGRITGSSSTNLSITNLTSGDSGNYTLVVTNLYGAATSQVATLQAVLAVPVITSPTNASGKQGYNFNYTVTAYGATPITFGATGLPDGLNINPVSGLISGIPSVAGIFAVNLFATNAAQTTAGTLILTLQDDIPVVTSTTNATGKQGVPFSYAIMATNDPVWFGAGPLPAGLSVNMTNGAISGIPLVSGSYAITLGATNLYGFGNETLIVNLASGLPFITSSLTKNGMQGQFLSYSIKATNNPTSFSTGPLPDGLNVNMASGVISGIPLLSGSFTVTITSINQFGSDSRTLTFNLTTGEPIINSPVTATAGEDQTGFIYNITARNSPTAFWATGLPTGLMVDTNTGSITGTPLYAGDYAIQLFAANAWGVGTAPLQLTITNLVVTNLVISDVITNYSSPYLLEFTFSLRDGDDPLTSHAVVASPALMVPTAFEDGVPVNQPATDVILQRVEGDGAKVLKCYLVLDFTESIAALSNGDTNGNGISDAVDAEIASAQNFVNQQPADEQIGVYEFHRDDEAPHQVLPLTTDKNLLNNAIGGIWTNYVQDFPAGSRAWDALTAAIGALGPANSDEHHFIVFMSDGLDDSSTSTMDDVITAATNAAVQIYGVGFGSELDTNALQNITSSTVGRYYTATNPSDLALDFAEIGKDLSSQYVLRWATLKRAATSFMPSFQLTYQGLTAVSPSNPPPFVSGTNLVVTTNGSGALITNTVFLYTTNYIIPPYAPTNFAGNVLAGSLRLVSDADVDPSAITLRATYVPRYIRQMRVHYRANWPTSVSLESTNTGEILEGWTLSETNDGAGGQWAVLTSPDPSLLADSIPFAAFGNLLAFSFHDPIIASNAFSEFDVDNTIYTNTAGTNFYGFTLTNTNAFYTFYVVPPPYGTPIPWLIANGFTNNFASAELLSPNGNGLTVWQDYLAGLNPLDTNSTFNTYVAPLPNPPQIVFNTVTGRTYRIDWAISPNGVWTVLRDGIAGTGGNVTFTDLRNLSGEGTMFYRVSVNDP